MVRSRVVAPAGDVATEVSDITTPAQEVGTKAAIENPTATTIKETRCMMHLRKSSFYQASRHDRRGFTYGSRPVKVLASMKGADCTSRASARLGGTMLAP